jgi:hypothetical protein
MDTIEILGYTKTIKHQRNTNFDHTHTIEIINPETEVVSAFPDPLADYNYTFIVYEFINKDGTLGPVLYTKSNADTGIITIGLTTIRVNDKINIVKLGTLYYESIMTHKTDAKKIYKYWFGPWVNEK